MCRDCRVPLVESPPEKKNQNIPPIQVRETLLTVVSDEVEFTRIESLMAAAGIPVLKKHRGSGEYLELYMGISPYGIEIYVPFDALVRAKAILSGEESLPESGEEPSQQGGGEAWASATETVLDPHEEQELQGYMQAVNQDMYQRKRGIAVMILISIVSGLVWSVYSIVKEFL